MSPQLALGEKDGAEVDLHRLPGEEGKGKAWESASFCRVWTELQEIVSPRLRLLHFCSFFINCTHQSWMPDFLGDRCCYCTGDRWEQSWRHHLSLAVANDTGWLSNNTDASSAGLISWLWQDWSEGLPLWRTLNLAGYQARKSFLRIPRL